MEKSVIVLVAVLAAMVIVGGVQAYQFNTLKDSLSKVKVSGAVSTGSAPAASGSGSGSGDLPGALANLPTQVGGC